MHTKSFLFLALVVLNGCDWDSKEPGTEDGPAKRDKTEENCTSDFTPEKSKELVNVYWTVADVV